MYSKIKNLIWKIFRNRSLQHLAFWLASYFVLLSIFSSSGKPQKIDYVYTTIFTITLFLGVSVNLFVLIPRLLTRKKYILFVAFFVLNILVFSWFNQILFSKLIDHILPGYLFISYYSYWEIMRFFIVLIGITSLIKLSKEWFELNEKRQKYIMIEKEKTEIELKALRAQVNPHFLFNSLNVIHSLSLKDSKQTSDAVIRLSEILRYVIYDSNTDFIELSDEIKLITNYIDLQKFRITPAAKIQFEMEVEEANIKLAPMLLLPLIENSYKHGVKGDISKTFINISLVSKEGLIKFLIMNNKGIAEEVVKENNNEGIGLENIKKRLQRIYPEQHTFIIRGNRGNLQRGIDFKC